LICFTVIGDEETHLEGETDKEFDIIVNILEEKAKDECGTIPITPFAITNMHKDASAIKKIRVLPSDEDKAG